MLSVHGRCFGLCTLASAVTTVFLVALGGWRFGRSGRVCGTNVKTERSERTQSGDTDNAEVRQYMRC